MTKDQFQYYAKLLGERDVDAIAHQWAELAEHDPMLGRLIFLETQAIKATVDYVRRKLEK